MQMQKTAYNLIDPPQEPGFPGLHSIDSAAYEAGFPETTVPARRPPVERLFLLSDALALLAAFLLGGLGAWTIDTKLLQAPLYPFFSLGTLREFAWFSLIGLLSLFWLDTKGHYVQRLPYWETMSHVVTIVIVGFLISGFMEFIFKSDDSRLWVALSWLVFGGLVFAGRSIVKAWLQRHDKWMIRALVIGEGPTLDPAVRALVSQTEMGYSITGVAPASILDDLTSSIAWAQFMQLSGANHFLLALPDHKISYYQAVLKSLVYSGLPYSIVPSSSALPFSTLSSHYLFTHGVTILHHTNRLQLMLPRLIKRSFDIAVAGAALTVTSPVMIPLVLLLKRDGGPALFRHRRIGRQGKSFDCLKFRSMVMNGEAVLQKHFAANPAALAEWQTEWKLREDPRVTRLGHFLRKTSLDELPQLINVLKGEMSLVGPRPIVPAECARYDTDIALYYMVRPGLTGLWQISGRNQVSYRERVEMDSRYVSNWSFWHDIAIMVKTVPALLNRTGAY
jgi:Undecaprenyl-phosphate galactose phosphotransferase WbaP